MIEEPFAHGVSFLHKRDARAKILAAVIYSITIATLSSFEALFLAFFFSLSLLLLSRLQPAPLLHRFALVNGFTLFLWITLPLTYGGKEILLGNMLPLSTGGLHTAAVISLKTNAIIGALIALVATSSIADLGHGLSLFPLPKKLIFILLYSYRYIFVIEQEYRRLYRAARIRAFHPQTNLHSYKTYAYLFAMTLVRSSTRAQRIHHAMILRGFTGQLHFLNTCCFSPSDGFFFILVCLFASLLFYINGP